MASPPSSRIAVVLGMIAIGAAVVTVAAGIASQPGCASNCGSNCPNTVVYVGSPNGEQLPIDDIGVAGPACPPAYAVYCIGDGPDTNCTHFTVTGTAQGACDVTIVFRDRPTEVVHLEFGPPVQQGCCKGYSIVGDSVFVISASSDAGINSTDGASDQVTVVVDGGTSDGNDAGTD